jgi:predicted lipoprotein with Yx(FWY)xxD motif
MRRLLVVGTCALLALAACSDDGDGGSGASPTAGTGTTGPSATESPSETPEASETPDATETQGSGRETEIETEDSALGTILADSDGNTLYVFLADGENESTCYDDCAATWPPLVARGEVEGGGDVDESLLGTTERTDGTLQVTFNGMPLYYFADDQAPGDTNGQGIGDVWYVVGPDGNPIQR